MSAMQYGRYQIVSELGKGAMGMVYKAHDPQIDRMVALKVLRQDRVVDQEFVRRFIAEAQAIGRLSHPNIVTVFDVGEDHGTIYIAMEFLEGRSLDLLIGEQAFSVKQIIDLGIQVAGALDYAHGQGIIHRDIKPGNIIITPQGHVKVTDFGIARIEGASGHQMTQMGEILGTPIYMPPEQVAGQPVDGRSDIYALGVVLYELATGQRPFAGENLTTLFNAIGKETPVTPARLNPQIPGEFSQVIMKCLSKSPGDRCQNGRSLSEALKGSLTSKPVVEAPYGKERKKRRTWAHAMAGLSVLAVFGALVYFLIPKPSILDVQSTPTGASFYLNGEYKGKTPHKVKLPYGKYKVRLEHEKYSNWEKLVNLDQPGETPLHARLEPDSRQSTLHVQSIPTGASFYLDSDYKGKTPQKVKLPYGKYKVRLEHEKYSNWEKQVNLDQPGETPLHARLKPVSKQSTLHVQSTPTGASFYLNGEYKGKTPHKVKLPYGKYKVRLKHEKYSNWEKQVNLDQPGETPLHARLKPDSKQSTLDVQTAPPGAGFYVNGKYQGKTPIKVKLPYGKYEVGLRHDKYFGWEAQLNLDKPGEIPLRIRLIPDD